MESTMPFESAMLSTWLLRLVVQARLGRSHFSASIFQFRSFGFHLIIAHIILFFNVFGLQSLTRLNC